MGLRVWGYRVSMVLASGDMLRVCTPINLDLKAPRPALLARSGPEVMLGFRVWIAGLSVCAFFIVPVHIIWT